MASQITLKEVHKAFCKRRGVKCVAKNLAKDLEWNCAEAAAALTEVLEAAGIKARSVYGFWHGECKSRPIPFHRHGWALVGREIWDPTRWVFEGKKPYLHKCPASSPEYDEGMRQIRKANRSPFPAVSNAKVVGIEWSDSTYQFLLKLTGCFRVPLSPTQFTVHQLMWVANADYLELGEHIEEIYTKLIENDLEMLIPMDYITWWKANK